MFVRETDGPPELVLSNSKSRPHWKRTSFTLLLEKVDVQFAMKKRSCVPPLPFWVAPPFVTVARGIVAVRLLPVLPVENRIQMVRCIQLIIELAEKHVLF